MHENYEKCIKSKTFYLLKYSTVLYDKKKKLYLEDINPIKYKRCHDIPATCICNWEHEYSKQHNYEYSILNILYILILSVSLQVYDIR